MADRYAGTTPLAAVRLLGFRPCCPVHGMYAPNTIPLSHPPFTYSSLLKLFSLFTIPVTALKPRIADAASPMFHNGSTLAACAGVLPVLELGLVMYIVLGSATVLKLVCWLVCGALASKSDSMVALAEVSEQMCW